MYERSPEKTRGGETPRVSVVIPAYNRRSYIRETLESVFAQTFRDFEVIVVDDGSTDGTEEVLALYGDRIRSFRQDNRGPSAARNLGVRHARGRWIAFQDSDDLSANDHLESLFGFVEKHPGYGMVFANGGYLGGPEHGRETIVPRNSSRRVAAKGVTLGDLFEKGIFRVQASLIAKSTLEEVGGFDESIRIGEDLDLAMRIWLSYPVAYLDKVVFLYRKHEGNLVSDNELRLLENIRVIEKLVRESPRARELLGPARIARRAAYRYYRLAKSCWKRSEKEKARRAIREAVLLRPFALKYRYFQFMWA